MKSTKFNRSEIMKQAWSMHRNPTYGSTVVFLVLSSLVMMG